MILSYNFDGQIFTDEQGRQLHEDLVPDVEGLTVVFCFSVAPEQRVCGAPGCLYLSPEGLYCAEHAAGHGTGHEPEIRRAGEGQLELAIGEAVP